MRIVAVEVRFLSLPLVEPFAASHGQILSRPLVTVRVVCDDSVDGWGEVSAMPEATYTNETAQSSYALLKAELAKSMVGESFEPEEIGPRLRTRNWPPMAIAGVEMALLDAHLRRHSQSLAGSLGVSASHVTAGAAIGLGNDKHIVSKTRELVSEGYGRLKLKVQPGNDRQAVAAARSEAPNVHLQVDANGSYDLDSVDSLVQMAKRYELQAIEQPFSSDDARAATALVNALAADDIPTVVVADESVESVVDVETLASQNALTAVSIKPARVGGLTNAVSMLERCRSLGLQATAGGMLESGLGRHALAAFAGLQGLSIPGDLSPASRWIADDPWPDIGLSDLGIAVPQGHGVAPEPDMQTLDRLTEKSFAQGR